MKVRRRRRKKKRKNENLQEKSQHPGSALAFLFSPVDPKCYFENEKFPFTDV